jgi:hypothetical protein
MVRLAWLILLVASGCTTRLDIEAIKVRNTDVQVDLGEVLASCDGTTTSDDAEVTFALGADGTNCTMHLAVSGVFLSIADLKQGYRDDVDGYPQDATVSIKHMRAVLKDLRFVSPAGDRLIDPIVGYWRASLALGDVPLAERAGSDSRSLFAGDLDLDLQAAVDPINEAVAIDGTLTNSGVIDAAMDVSSIATTLAGNTAATFAFTVSVTFDLHVSKTAASAL